MTLPNKPADQAQPEFPLYDPTAHADADIDNPPPELATALTPPAPVPPAERGVSRRRMLWLGAAGIAAVGVAMAGAGTAVALETADLALVQDDLSRLPFLIRLARRTLRTIRLNVALALGFNGLAILGSWAGLLSPVAASVAHNVGSIAVVASAASLAFAREN